MQFPFISARRILKEIGLKSTTIELSSLGEKSILALIQKIKKYTEELGEYEEWLQFYLASTKKRKYTRK